jgi:S1-C subfamily serine protease
MVGGDTMSRKIGFLALVVALVAAAPVLAGEGGCKGSAQDCLNKMAAELAARGWVGLELEYNDDEAMVVSRVVPDSPGQQAGFQTGDVLVALNGVEFGEENAESLKKIKYQMTPGKEVTYTVARHGHKKDLPVTLAEMPDEILAQWIGGHMLEGHVTVASADE